MTFDEQGKTKLTDIFKILSTQDRYHKCHQKGKLKLGKKLAITMQDSQPPYLRQKTHKPIIK